MRVIVNDASCLIDLYKGNLLVVFFELPYDMVIPLPIRESEMPGLFDQQWRQLDDAGLITYNLTPNDSATVMEFKRLYPGLSANDCFCLVTSQVYPGMLLTGDAHLSNVAERNELYVRGALWVIDKLTIYGRKLLQVAVD